MRSNPALKSWYRKINKKFFDNQLTNNVCVRWANEDDDGEVSKFEEKFFGWADVADDGKHEYVIVLSKKLNVPKSTRLTTLAHEMVHVATNLRDNHGEAFSEWHKVLTEKGFFEKGKLVKGLTIF
jgi:hypothetical protein